MRFLSVCSGIEAASVAWHPLGWRATAFSEIEAFPRCVLAHHYPDVPNLGSMTHYNDWPDADIDVLVGGTPCQSFSVAGLRRGLDDPRGNLMLTFGAIAGRYRPKWLVWENVPGVLSSNGGRDFGTFLGMLAELGYGFAYRVLDAQYFRVAQRRRRVFVVGHLGDWRRAAAVLFERHSLSGHPAPRREAGENPAPTLSARTQGGGGLGTDFECDGGLIPQIVCQAMSAKWSKGTSGPAGDEHHNLIPVAHSLRGEGFDASEDGTGRGIPLVPVAFSCKDDGSDAGSIVPTLRAMGKDCSHDNGGGQIAVAFHGSQDPCISGDITHPVGRNQVLEACAQVGAQVRRLTPRECERLQGFPDDHTAITVSGKPAADGPRYKALGNSMAVPVMRWIGRRIEIVDAIPR